MSRVAGGRDRRQGPKDDARGRARNNIRPATALFCLFGSICFFAAAAAAAGGQEAAEAPRPKIGLALSGGGARGAAHVGVLKLMEELRIPIDVIAGTSMGSIVGGLYAMGMSPTEIERQLAEMDWDELFNDQQARPERSFRRKKEDVLHLSKAAPGVKERRLRIRTALIQGQKFDTALKRLTLPVVAIDDFDDLKIPFRAVATDITTGKEVVLGSGDLALAIRASMAVPAAFAGVEIEGTFLVDGGIANNLPVSVVRRMGADIVIAVDISTPLTKREDITSVLSIVGQLSGFLTRRNTEEQIALLGEKDLLIVPDLRDITSADFDRVLEAVNIGYDAAAVKRAQLARYSVDPHIYAAYVQDHTDKRGQVPTIDFIRIENNSRVSDALLESRLNIPLGQPLDADELEKSIARIYGLELFESVGYRIVNEQGRRGVVVEAKEKSWGTSNLKFGMELSGELGGGGSSFNVRTLYTHEPINDLAGEWRIGAQVGQEPAIFWDIYQPLNPLSRYFLHGVVFYKTERGYVYSTEVEAPPLAEYSVDRAGFGLGVGRELGTLGRLSTGYRYAHGEAELEAGIPVYDMDRFDAAAAYLKVEMDTLDNVAFPTRGTIGRAEWTASREDIGSDNDFDQLTFLLGGAHSIGDNIFLGKLAFNTTLDDEAPVQDLFRIGGLMHLSGLQTRQLSGQHTGFLLAGYMRRLYHSKFFPLYGGGSLEMGNAWQTDADIAWDSALLAGSLFLGADTLIGPIYLGYGLAEGGNSALYFYLGKPWY